jgi:hypothetical protein
MLRKAGWLVIGILIAAAAYELAVALGAESLGPNPGDDVAGAGVVRAVALFASLAAVPLAVGFVPRPWRAAALLAPAAAAFVLPLYFTFDPYYAPDERRYIDNGGWSSPAWMIGFGVVGVVTGLLTALLPRVGAAASVVVLLLLFGLALFVGVGH